MRMIATIAAGAAIALSCAASAGAQEVTLRFQHFLSPKAAVPTNFIEPWARKVEEDSGGRIRVEIYPAMQLGGTPPMLFDQIRDNVIDGGWAIPGYTPDRFPGAEVFELPFIGSNNAENTSKAAWEFYQKHLAEEFSEIHVMAVHVHGPGAFHTKGVAVEGVDDLQGLTLRAPTRIASQSLEALGAVPVGMPVPQLPEALSKGVVDGGVIPFEIVPPLRIHELATAHTIVGGDRSFYNTVFIWGMNKAVYNDLPDDLKAVIDANSGEMASAWAGRAMDEGDEPGLSVVRSSDNTIVTLSAEERARMQEMTKPVVEAWIEEMSAQGYPAEQMVEDARAMVAQYD